MALQGSLKIGGRTYGVVECEYEFSQKDENGMPTSRPKGGEIKITLPSTSDDDMFFYNWMFHKSEVKAGILRLRIYTSDNKLSYKTISFANAYCVYLKDHFSDHDEKLMYTTISILAQVIRIGAANSSVFINKWISSSADMIVSNLNDFVVSTIAEKLNPF